MTPTISLCMPTYSRARQLSIALPALLEAVRTHSHGSEFEICVSDNASQDDTANVIARVVGQFDGMNVRCERQARNLGFAGNFAAVMRLAIGDTFVLLADDDELKPEALDLLLSATRLVTAQTPLVLFDTLPGGDAVFRRMPRPTERTTIHGPHELLQLLGIFHATFVSNLLFHRETALAKLTPAMLQSRYPHTAVTLTMLCDAPATFVPGKLVNVTLPADTGDQPLLTCVDMARVMSDYALGDSRSKPLRGKVYRFLMKMIPTAVYLQRTEVCVGDGTNPFAALTATNLRDCYRHSALSRMLAVFMYWAACCTPLVLLRGILRRVSRHAR